VELVPVFLVVSVMVAFIGVPVFLSWWRNRS
jgi:Tfp pilus assembly protein FimT